MVVFSLKMLCINEIDNKFLLCHSYRLFPSNQASQIIFEKGRSLYQIPLSLSLSLNTKIVSKRCFSCKRKRASESVLCCVSQVCRLCIYSGSIWYHIKTLPQAGFDPPKQREDYYQFTTLSPSHHGWIFYQQH